MDDWGSVMRYQTGKLNPIRNGFTLLELLMVIAIISVLMSMTFYVMNGMTENAEHEATKATMLKVTRLLEQRIEAFERAFKGSRKNSYITGTVRLLQAIDGRFDHFLRHPEQAPPAIVMLARKAGFRFEFPQRMAELLLAPSDDTNGNLLPDSIEAKIAIPNARIALMQQNGGTEPTAAEIQTFVDQRWQKHVTNRTAGTDITESSELLYYTLVASGTFGSSSVDADQFSPVEVIDSDEDGLPEFVDAWGQPLRFYRWPTRLIDPNAPNPFAPDFATIDDNTEIDVTPNDDDGNLATQEDTDDLREVFFDERAYASLLMKGLPPAPVTLPGGSTQRDPLLVDPDDPVGLLYTFIEDPQYIDMGIDLTLEFNEAKYHTPDTYHVPIVVSAGADGVLGLREPHDTIPASGIYGNLAQYAGTTVSAPFPASDVRDALLDNVTSRNRRAGGKR